MDAIDHGGTRIALQSAGQCEGSSTRFSNRSELLELNTTKSLDEYLKIYLKFPIPASRLGPIARIFEYVATAAPGVTEILTIGKVGSEVRGGDWDRVIIDAPATGHVVELIAAPDNLGSVIKLGPLADQTKWLAAILEDHDRTGIWIVTTPEELPVTESLELADRIASETRVGLAGAVINRMPHLIDQQALDEADRLVADPSASDGLRTAAAMVALQTRTALRESTRFADAWSSTDLPWLTVPLGADQVDMATRAWSGRS